MENCLVSIVNEIATERMRIAQDLHLLDETARSILNNRESIFVADVDLVVAEVDKILDNRPQLQLREESSDYSSRSLGSCASPSSITETFSDLSPIFPGSGDIFCGHGSGGLTDS